MAEEKFVVFSINDSKAKEIAKAIASDTAKSILDLIASKRRSPSEISKELNLPMSTVQYNLDMLKAAGLIKASAFKYSKKGRKIQYYEPARKAIVIAPEESKKNIIELLGDKVIIPVIALIAVVSGYVSSFFTLTPAPKTEMAMAAGSVEGAQMAAAPTEMWMDVIPQPSLVEQYFPYIVATLVFVILLTIYLLYKKFYKK